MTLHEALRPGARRTLARCVDGTAKHGVYEPMTVWERMAKIRRHWNQYQDGLNTEDHLAAIAANALLAMRAEEDARQTPP